MCLKHKEHIILGVITGIAKWMRTEFTEKYNTHVWNY